MPNVDQYRIEYLSTLLFRSLYPTKGITVLVLTNFACHLYIEEHKPLFGLSIHGCSYKAIPI